LDINEARNWCEENSAVISFYEYVPKEGEILFDDEIIEDEEVAEDMRVCVKMRSPVSFINYRVYGKNVVEAVQTLKEFSQTSLFNESMDDIDDYDIPDDIEDIFKDL